MARLIDSSVLISFERESRSVADLRRIVSGDRAVVSAITASELLAGIHRADSPERRARRSLFVESILSELDVIAIDLGVARVHARISAALISDGKPIGAHDFLIAATALAHGCVLLTDNKREFRRVPDLIVELPDWSIL